MVTFCKRASQVVLEVKNPPAYAGDSRDTDLIPGSGRSPGGGHGNPLQYSRLENPMDRGAWWAIVHGVTDSWTPVKWPDTHILYRRKTRICMVLCFTGKKEPGLLFISIYFLGREGLSTYGHQAQYWSSRPLSSGSTHGEHWLGCVCF